MSTICGSVDPYWKLHARVMGRPEFRVWPSSITKHHAWEGGNLTHTFEVMEIVGAMAATAARAGVLLNGELLQVAALLHDYGKLCVYEKTPEGWRYTADYTKSLHIEKSIEAAKELLPEAGYPADFVAAVVDCIGSHHGRVEWGALWEPRTHEAWLLHLADMASAMTMGKCPVRSSTPAPGGAS